MESPKIPTNQLCVVTVAFPFVSDAEALDVKTKISEAVGELPQVKMEFRITEMRNGNILGNS